ncbi:ROK family transcriptional regulator [Nonomuraea soli]|uniref:Putative NBD/HSP70 family sugar kinase n=1 Tax=Nonomuraea soli TaxID=1032476 RepID=A0A7W0CP04_9ACTN|nr:ROK family transcriptional regulator [Nonomuraea soli]MBA2894681.1 putative NBD/HSP70 family sugar kinase [Nonomuraea soli]
MKTATPSLARAINDRLALDLLLEHGPLTAPQLRELTGLSRPTVSDLIERLQAHGLIEVTGESGEDRRGPNAKLYGLVAGLTHAVGVDVRRSAVHVTVADLTGRVVGEARSTLGPGTADLAAEIAATVRKAADGRDLKSVVLGAPGLVHPHTGEARGEGVPGWRTDLRTAVQKLLPEVETVLENEVNVAAIAEHRLGAASGRDDFALIWLDDGVGGAIVLDGKVRRGASGGAGEVGLLELDGEPFCCAIEHTRALGTASEELVELVAASVFTVASVLDPGLVVLGGSIGRAGGAELAALVQEKVAARSPAPTEIRASTVEGNAILQGAVLTALALARDAAFG